MDRTQLLQHFDTLADTPEAVEKLRAFVLDLAIRGSLVPQNPKDAPAIELVELAKAVLAKNRKKSDDQNNGEPEIPPFSLPKNWCWTCLDELGDTAPKNELDEKVEVGFSPMRLVNAKYGEPISFERRAWSEVRKGFTHFAEGDVVVAKITPCFQNGKSGVIRGAPNGFGAGTTELHVLRPVANCVLPDYALIFVKSPHFLINGEAHMTGTAGQKRVSWDYFAKTPFPLPPLAEQRRIVAKVEELLALCDELEARQTVAREHRTRLVRSALDHLTTGVRPSPGAATPARTKVSENANALLPHHAAAPEDGRTPEDFRRHAAFVLNKFPDLTAAPEDVPALRQAILSLAVQGKLLPQNAQKDGTAEQALNNRRSRIKSDGASRKKSRIEFEAIEEEDIPKPVPENWKWIRFGEVADRLEYGTSEKAFPNSNGVPTLRMGNIQEGKLDFENLKYVSHECPDLPKLFLDDGDIIFNRTNSAELVGKAAVFRGKPKSFTLASYLIRVSLDEAIASPDFFNLAINSSYYRRTQIEPELTQQCGQANFSGSKLANSVVPLPPLAEQQRIVAKVDELLRWCDALEARLTAARTTATHLLDATLHQILAA